MKRAVFLTLKIYKNSLSLILLYLFGPGCRFTPTCSEYAAEAVEKHGVGRGTVLSIKRLFACHPFSASRFDPVKEK